jgi:hypothetical protein
MSPTHKLIGLGLAATWLTAGFARAVFRDLVPDFARVEMDDQEAIVVINALAGFAQASPEAKLREKLIRRYGKSLGLRPGASARGFAPSHN